jgi:hypothetical protein
MDLNVNVYAVFGSVSFFGLARGSILHESSTVNHSKWEKGSICLLIGPSFAGRICEVNARVILC